MPVLHEKVREHRERLRISQAALARAAGVPRSQLAIFESGGNITLSTLQKILGQLPGLRLDVLQTGFDVDEARRAALQMQDVAQELHAAAGRLAEVLGAAGGPAPGGGGATRHEAGIGEEQRERLLKAVRTFKEERRRSRDK